MLSDRTVQARGKWLRASLPRRPPTLLAERFPYVDVARSMQHADDFNTALN